MQRCARAILAAERATLTRQRALGKDEPEAKILALEWGENVKLKADGVARVLEAMRYQRGKIPRGKRRTDITRAIKFLARQNRLGCMKYTVARHRHYPIGTGVTSPTPVCNPHVARPQMGH